MLYRNGKPFNRQKFAMRRDNVARGYIKGEHLPARKTKKQEKTSQPVNNPVILHTDFGTSFIAASLYFIESKELCILFKSGLSAKFFDVEHVVNFGLCHAKSADNYFNEVIAPKYRCEIKAA